MRTHEKGLKLVYRDPRVQEMDQVYRFEDTREKKRYNAYRRRISWNSKKLVFDYLSKIPMRRRTRSCSTSSTSVTPHGLRLEVRSSTA